MSPGDEWNDKRLDDLAHQVRVVAALTTLVATHDAKIDGLFDDVQAIVAARDKNMARYDKSLEELRDEHRAAVRAWSEACDKKVDRLEAKIDAQAQAAQANKWSPTQWAAVLGPTMAALIGLAAVLLGGGGGG